MEIISRLPKRLQKPAEDLKPAGKAALAIGTTGLIYAGAYTTARGVGNALVPEGTQKADHFIRYTDPGLFLQTAAMIGSTGLAIKFLESTYGKALAPNFFGKRFPQEAKLMKSAVTGLAVYRLMTGLSVGDVGQRFQALFDANLPAAVSLTPGPYLNRPSNISALNDVVLRPAPNMPPAGIMSSDYYSSVYQPRLDAQLALQRNALQNVNNGNLNKPAPITNPSAQIVNNGNLNKPGI